MSRYDVVLKKIKAQRVATVRDVVPTPPDQRRLWEELLDYLHQNKVRMVGTPMAIYHDKEAKERDWDIEVAMPIDDDPVATNRVKIHDLPAVETMACVVHTGPFATISEAYDAIARWIRENHYQITGPSRELNLQMPKVPGDQNDPKTVNEIQFPVEKV